MFEYERMFKLCNSLDGGLCERQLLNYISRIHSMFMMVKNYSSRIEIKSRAITQSARLFLFC
jgi:hypothetical protein